MKKLNRKGFTLVELLAVIVILAIVVGITLVTVLPTLKSSRQQAFELTAQTAANYIEKQYQLYLVDNDNAALNDVLKTAFASEVNSGEFDDDLYTAAGLKPENYNGAGTWSVDSNGRACVELTANSDGEYYDATGTARSSACS